eukprot:scaffold2331_cov252-Pinguiococcus_pyrenoidosus.AAC.2
MRLSSSLQISPSCRKSCAFISVRARDTKFKLGKPKRSSTAAELKSVIVVSSMTRCRRGALASFTALWISSREREGSLQWEITSSCRYSLMICLMKDSSRSGLIESPSSRTDPYLAAPGWEGWK